MRIFWSKILWTRSSTKKLYQRPELIQGCWMVIIFQVSMKKHLLGRIRNLCFGIFWMDIRMGNMLKVEWEAHFDRCIFFSALVFASSVYLVQVSGILPLFCRQLRDGRGPPLCNLPIVLSWSSSILKEESSPNKNDQLYLEPHDWKVDGLLQTDKPEFRSVCRSMRLYLLHLGVFFWNVWSFEDVCQDWLCFFLT